MAAFSLTEKLAVTGAFLALVAMAVGTEQNPGIVIVGKDELARTRAGEAPSAPPVPVGETVPDPSPPQPPPADMAPEPTPAPVLPMQVPVAPPLPSSSPQTEPTNQGRPTLRLS